MSFILSSCFISDVGVFFGAFLGPIFAILLFNAVIYAVVIRVLIKHSRSTLGRPKEEMNKKTMIRLLISITGVMFLFGLTWLFGALTITGFGDSRASTAFQVIFVILNAFQGFFIFLFFCVFSNDARESWLEVFTCGHYKSKLLHPSLARYASSGAKAFRTKGKTLHINLAQPSTNTAKNFSSSTNGLTEERYSNIPLTSAAEEAKKEKPMEPILNGFPEVHETNADKDFKSSTDDDFKSNTDNLTEEGYSNIQLTKAAEEAKKEKAMMPTSNGSPEFQEAEADKDTKSDIGLADKEGKDQMPRCSKKYGSTSPR